MKMLRIVDFPGYFAGEDGNIYSEKRGGHIRRLKAALDSKGRYYFVVLRRNGRSIPRLVHRLVCASFYGECPSGCVTSHLDGNCKNNVPGNLRWESQKRNLFRKKQHGTDDVGVNNTRALFDEGQIKLIRVMLSDGVTHRNIGFIMNCNERTIGKIKRGERYKNQGIIS